MCRRWLIKQFYNFRVTCSHDELLEFKASAAAAAVGDSAARGMLDGKNDIIQVVSGNFDTKIPSDNGLFSCTC